MHTHSVVALVALTTLALLHCDSGEKSDPVEDRKVIANIEGTWEAPSAEGTVTITLCERTVLDSEVSTCDTTHVVRSTNTEEQSIEKGGVGCGGCPNQVQGFLTARVVAANGATTEVDVTLTLPRQETYEFPYELRDDGGDLAADVTAPDRFSLRTLDLQATTANDQDASSTVDATPDLDAATVSTDASYRDAGTGARSDNAVHANVPLTFTRRSAGGCR